MSLQFLNDRSAKQSGKEYTKPEEILNDVYLSPSQKYMVLEAMLSEAKDEVSPRQAARLTSEIIKAQSDLKKQMD